MTMRRSRDVWSAVLSMLALAVVMYIATARQEADSPALPPLAARSTQPDGARALLLWMKELGYTIDATTGGAFAIPEDAAIVLLLEPLLPVQSAELEAIDRWLDGGGTLIIAGESLWTWPWASHFGATMRPESNWPIASIMAVQTPLWTMPPQTEFPHNVQMRTGFRLERADAVVHGMSFNVPVVTAIEQGQGRVIITSLLYPFTNAGLQQAGNPEFVLNVLALAGAPGQVWYNEWHRLGPAGAGDTGNGFGAWLRTSTAGRALLLAGFIIFVAVLLNGRSFGRPLMLPEQRLRRTPLEYVTAMANLQRRARHRHALLMDYHMRLKRAYARRYHITAALPDDEFAARVADADPAVDAAELGGLLAALANPHVGEEEMVRLAATAAAWTENHPSHRKGTPHAD